MHQTTCSFIGLGLIGGSVAKALKLHNKNIFIKVYDTDSKSLELAFHEKIADTIYSSITEEFCQCDYLFLCAPVSINLENLEIIAPILPKNCIVTDVGSVKNPIHEKIHQLHLQSQFIGGHPMTGSERVGYLNSNATLLENAYYVLTPEPDVCESKVKEFHELVKTTGALPLLLNVKRHDETTAAISHLPHLIASSLVNLVKYNDDTNSTFKTLAAGGFKDITRIASANPKLWQQITLENNQNILGFLSTYIDSLTELKEQLTVGNKDYLYNFFETAREYRDSFIDTRSGPFIQQFVLTVDIPDKSGALADVVNLLAKNNISIKNIGIVHNREYQEGVLRMEFYSIKEYKNAIFLLVENDYSVHKQ
ncbi:MAG: prephenate dehydrogenase [Lachnospiraceae bacterium]|nr:prephenate dehydrogenase [Lachnospiraceae bacterium]